MRRILQNSSGMTLVELMVATVIVMTMTLGMAGVFQSISGTQERNQITSTAISLQSTIISGFADTDTISSGINTDGSLASSGRVVFPGSFGSSTSLTLNANTTTTGGSTYFTKDFNTCAGFSKTQPDCTIRVDLSVKTIPSAGDPRYGYAYRILFSPSLGSIAAIGNVNEQTGASTTTFSDIDYTSIPNKHAARCTDSSCQEQKQVSVCDPNQHLAAYSVDLILKKVKCMDKPADCPVDSGSVRYMAKGIDVSGSTTLITKMKCVGIKKAKCPTNYALSSVKMESLEDGSSAPVGTCNFAAASSVTGSTYVGKLLLEKFVQMATTVDQVVL